MIVTEHFPNDSVQVLEEKATPPVPDTFSQVMVPMCDLYPPVTVAVHLIFVPTAKDDFVQEMAVLVWAVPAFRTVIRSHGLVAPLLFLSPL